MRNISYNKIFVKELNFLIKPILAKEIKELKEKESKASKRTFAKISAEATEYRKQIFIIENFLSKDIKWHPKKPHRIRCLGAIEDYTEVFEFPCCGIQIYADSLPSQFSIHGCTLKLTI